MKDNYSWLDRLLDIYRRDIFESINKSYNPKETNSSKLGAKQTLISQIEIEKLRAKIDSMQQAKSRVLRRTEIPADAKEPTRDIVVITGEECAKIIDLDIANLTEKLKELEK